MHFNWTAAVTAVIALALGLTLILARNRWAAMLNARRERNLQARGRTYDPAQDSTVTTIVVILGTLLIVIGGFDVLAALTT